MDPFVEWVQLGEDITDGIMAWVSIGIDPTADSEVSSAATVYEDGDVANENSMGGMGGGPPGGGNGTGPGAARSSGSLSRNATWRPIYRQRLHGLGCRAAMKG